MPWEEKTFAVGHGGSVGIQIFPADAGKASCKTGNEYPLPSENNRAYGYHLEIFYPDYGRLWKNFHLRPPTTIGNFLHWFHDSMEL